MKKVLLVGFIVVIFTEALPWLNAESICDNSTVQQNGLVYELWKDSGQACMTCKKGDSLTIEWQQVSNMVVRVGKRPGSEDNVFNYTIDLQTDGNAWAGVYGWAQNPESDDNEYLEFYIVETWGAWRPPGATPLGSMNSDGVVYEIYRVRRHSPIIQSSEYNDQYYSVIRNKRNSGTITVSNHFSAWEQKGMKMGPLYDVSFAVQAYQSSGSAKITGPLAHDCFIAPTEPPKHLGDVNGDTKIDIIDALLVTQVYVGIKVSNFIKTNADVNHDDEITIIDALLIAQCYVGQVSCGF